MYMYPLVYYIIGNPHITHPCNKLYDLDKEVQRHVSWQHASLSTGKQALEDETQAAGWEEGGRAWLRDEHDEKHT